MISKKLHFPPFQALYGRAKCGDSKKVFQSFVKWSHILWDHFKTAATLERPFLFSTLCTTPIGDPLLRWYIQNHDNNSFRSTIWSNILHVGSRLFHQSPQIWVHVMPCHRSHHKDAVIEWKQKQVVYLTVTISMDANFPPLPQQILAPLHQNI